MTRNFKMRSLLLAAGIMTAGLFAFSSCGSKNETGDTTEKTVKKPNPGEDEAFYETQPVRSGLYDADYYNITGPNARKGRFDGRIYFSLHPTSNIFYLYENGNRTKIDFIGYLKAPFEKGDSGIYYTEDTIDMPVTIDTDSTAYILSFKDGENNYSITFSPKPRHTGTAIEILERMAEQKKKNNNR